MAITSRNTYAESVAAGMPFWRLDITTWGNTATGADPNSLQYTAAAVGSAQYLVIGPDSTADIVTASYRDNADNFVAKGSTPPSMSVGIVRPGVVLPGALIIDAYTSTLFGDTYYRDGDPNEHPFGGTEPLCEQPTLQLLAYTTTPANPVYPKRNDMYRTTTVELAGGGEQLVRIWPVMGRSCKAVYMRATGTAVATIRVGAITTGNAGAPIEDTVTTADVNAVTGVQESIITGRPMQWLAVYATLTAGAGNLNVNLIAQDC